MDTDAAIITAAREGRAEFEVSRSRFVGIAYPAGSDAEADEKLAAARREHPFARHICYARSVKGGVKSSDAGEPSGTAGRPIAGVIEKSGVTDVLIVVARYFGGVKLGAGNLARAYGRAAARALAAAGRAAAFETPVFTAEFTFSDAAKIRLPPAGRGAAGGVVTELSRSFGESVSVTFAAPSEAALRDALGALAAQTASLAPSGIRRLYVNIDTDASADLTNG